MFVLQFLVTALLIVSQMFVCFFFFQKCLRLYKKGLYIYIYILYVHIYIYIYIYSVYTFGFISHNLKIYLNELFHNFPFYFRIESLYLTN